MKKITVKWGLIFNMIYNLTLTFYEFMNFNNMFGILFLILLIINIAFYFVAKKQGLLNKKLF